MAIINAEGTPGGALYRAVNKVADGLKDEFPNVAVDTLAYQWGRPAPKITKVPLDLDAYVYACSLPVLCLNLALDSICQLWRLRLWTPRFSAAVFHLTLPLRCVCVCLYSNSRGRT